MTATTLPAWKRAIEVAVLVAAALVMSAAAVDAASGAPLAAQHVPAARI